MPRKTQTTNGAATPSATPQSVPSVEALRALPDLDVETRSRIADRLGAVLDSLAQPAPAFLATLSQAGDDSDLAPADTLLGSARWPDTEGVTETLGRLRAVLASTSAMDLFGDVGEMPRPYYSRPRLGFQPGDTTAPHPMHAARLGNAAAGCSRYECELTGRVFDLPFGSPVPALLFDTPGTARSGPLDFAARLALHPAEYVEADTEAPASFTVHPALVEAGPAHVLRAAWRSVERQLFDATEALISVYDLASALSGVEPDAIAVEWPARAYRRWERTERPGEARTWRRELAGVSVK